MSHYVLVVRTGTVVIKVHVVAHALADKVAHHQSTVVIEGRGVIVWPHYSSVRAFNRLWSYLISQKWNGGKCLDTKGCYWSEVPTVSNSQPTLIILHKIGVFQHHRVPDNGCDSLPTEVNSRAIQAMKMVIIPAQLLAKLTCHRTHPIITNMLIVYQTVLLGRTTTSPQG
ncbi:hypothetical protein P691DRAFT_783545 [Macrolepiota fuliginosa MF-IS2]|uniref:Uncharacterized protein n=1 Tax=Macrolepiota fuliginosa MF-IS2 TaxID=1400762 RepID=A0A9P6BVQ9_9AGAR|nr:hypothetical protein P691DRAFT_783545 [Macrolepiota fuliginosa MF-IS2]